MLFNSHAFIFLFLPLTLLVFFGLGRFSAKLAAGWLAIASLFFYGWWSPAAKEKWARILALLDWREPPRPPERPPWAMTCRCCGKPMTRVSLLLPCRPP